MEDIAKLLEADSEWLSAADLAGKEKVLKITKYEIVKEKDGKSKTVQKLVLHIEGSDKKYKPCKTQARVICNPEYCGWGTKPAEFTGRYLEVKPEKVLFKGELVWGIRICGASHIKADFTAKVVEGMKKYDYAIRKIDADTKKQDVKSDAKTEEQKWSGKEGANARDVKKANALRAQAAKERLIVQINQADSIDALTAIKNESAAVIARLKEAYPEHYKDISDAIIDAEERTALSYDPETGEIMEDKTQEVDLF